MSRAAPLLATTVALLGGMALATAAPWPASSYRNTDFFQFWAAPQALLEGASPYDHDWIVAFAARVGSHALDYWPAGWVSPYPVWTDVLTLPLALVPYRVAAAAWLVSQLAALGLGLFAIARGMFRVPRREALVLGGLIVGFEPLWALIGGGNVTGFVTAVLAGAVAASAAGHALLAGVLLGLLIAKPHLAIAIVPLFVALAPAARRRVLAAGAAGVALVLVVASLLVRPGWPGEWLDATLVQRMSAEANASAWTLDRVLPPAVGLSLVLGAILAFSLWLRRDHPAFETAIAAGIALALFLAPHERHYDQLLLLVPAALLVARLADLDAYERVLAIAAGMVVFVLVPWWLYGIAVARGIPRAVPDLHEEWSALVPLCALAIVVAVDHVAHRHAAPASLPSGIASPAPSR